MQNPGKSCRIKHNKKKQKIGAAFAAPFLFHLGYTAMLAQAAYSQADIFMRAKDIGREILIVKNFMDIGFVVFQFIFDLSFIHDVNTVAHTD